MGKVDAFIRVSMQVVSIIGRCKVVLQNRLPTMPNLTRSSSVEETISSLADILLSSADCPVDDLTEQLQAMGHYPFAGGGYSDVYKYRARSSLPEGRNQGIKVFAVKAANAKLCVGERRKSMKVRVRFVLEVLQG